MWVQLPSSRPSKSSRVSSPITLFLFATKTTSFSPLILLYDCNMGKKKNIEVKEILKLAGQGKNKMEVAAILGCSDRQIHRILDRNNKKQEFNDLLKESKQKIDYQEVVDLKLSNPDYSCQDIADQCAHSLDKVTGIISLAINNGEVPAQTCLLCHDDHDCSYGGGVFCSQQCARVFSTQNMDEESHQKRIAGLNKANKIKTDHWKIWNESSPEDMPNEVQWIVDTRENALLPPCHKVIDIDSALDLFIQERKKRQEESGYNDWMKDEERKRVWKEKISQTRKERIASGEIEIRRGFDVSEETRKKLSIAVNQRIAEGKHKGWSVRGKGVESYPEKFWRGVFENHGVVFEQEFVVRKSDVGLDSLGNYFLDFLVECPDGSLVDIEIDGKQHSYPERKQSDAVRDEALVGSGFIVHRIPWINPASQSGVVRGQIVEVLELLNGHGCDLPLSVDGV